MVIALVLVWALVLGLSPGLALMVGALALMLLDWLHPPLLERLLGSEG